MNRSKSEVYILDHGKIDILQEIHKRDLEFPYETKFSLHKVIENWEQKARSSDPFISGKAKILLELINSYPGVDQPFSKMDDIGDANDMVHHLFSDVYAVDFGGDEALSVTTPFIFEFLYQTSKFQRILENIDENDEIFAAYLKEGILLSRLFQAYSFLFREVYGIELQQADIPLVIPYKNPETGLVRYYSEEAYIRYVDLDSKDAPKLTQEQIEELMSDYGNIELWMKYLPPEKIRFNGVALLKFIDVTERESLTRLQAALLEDSLLTIPTLRRIQRIMSNFLEVREVRVGLIAYDDVLDMYKINEHIWSSVLIRSGVNFSHRKLKRLFAEKFKTTQDILIIRPEDESLFPEKIRKKIIETGTKSIMLAPLFKDDKLIGILEISSKKETKVNFAVNRLTKVLPLFELAVERSTETVHNRIQTIIKENCTAIHPSVEWKFVKQAQRAYRKVSFKDAAIPSMKPIVFERVYPLYGLFDVRNSALTQSKAMARDLAAQLDVAIESVQNLRRLVRLRILDQLEYRLNDLRFDEDILSNTQQAEEIYLFFQEELNPFFEELKKDRRIDQRWVNHYLDRLDPDLGIVYERRKAFENSIQTIVRTISNLIDREQTNAQAIYPHYFEKFKTDGVDYNIFIGQSISPSLSFSHVFLRNLRLWQLENMVNISLFLRNERFTLEMPLQTAQMIYVQNVPIDIRFRYDEKRFDVDGTFNARFEIIKKRLDKATILNTEQRLTQPDHIAIVYSHNAVIGEYLDYIEYLQHKKLLTSKIEFLELNDLQGLEGMKAIRVELAKSELDEGPGIQHMYSLDKA